MSSRPRSQVGRPPPPLPDHLLSHVAAQEYDDGRSIPPGSVPLPVYQPSFQRASTDENVGHDYYEQPIEHQNHSMERGRRQPSAPTEEYVTMPDMQQESYEYLHEDDVDVRRRDHRPPPASRASAPVAGNAYLQEEYVEVDRRPMRAAGNRRSLPPVPLSVDEHGGEAFDEPDEEYEIPGQTAANVRNGRPAGPPIAPKPKISGGVAIMRGLDTQRISNARGRLRPTAMSLSIRQDRNASPVVEEEEDEVGARKKSVADIRAKFQGSRPASQSQAQRHSTGAYPASQNTRSSISGADFSFVAMAAKSDSFRTGNRVGDVDIPAADYETSLPSRSDIPLPPTPRSSGQRQSQNVPPSSLKSVPPLPVADYALENQSWYFDSIDRYQSELKVTASNKEGAFVVRRSKTSANPYVLSVFHDGRLFHLYIRHTNNNQFAVGSEKPGEMLFSSVVELINYYEQSYLEVVTTDVNKKTSSSRVKLVSAI